LNPSLLRMTTPRDMDFDLHLPPGTKDVYQQRVKDIPEDKRTSWRFHIVRAGESLDSIASGLHARPSEIAAVNRLASTDSINTDDELIVPVTVAAATHPMRYITRIGDTLVTIADRFNVSVEDLRRWNHLSSSAIKPHSTLDVTEPVRLAPVTHVKAKTLAAANAKTKGVSAMRSPAAKTSSSAAVTKSAAATKGVNAP
jgi:membrane-bound lytic murein transglycosylase D